MAKVLTKSNRDQIMEGGRGREIDLGLTQILNQIQDWPKAKQVLVSACLLKAVLDSEEDVALWEVMDVATRINNRYVKAYTKSEW